MSEQNTQQATDSTTQAKVYADLTPYAAHKVINTMLQRAGIDVKVSSQAMYSRASKNIIASYRLDNGKWMYKGDAFAKWAKRYVEYYKNGGSKGKTDYEQLADQYM